MSLIDLLRIAVGRKISKRKIEKAKKGQVEDVEAITGPYSINMTPDGSYYNLFIEENQIIEEKARFYSNYPMHISFGWKMPRVEMFLVYHKRKVYDLEGNLIEVVTRKK